jgi:signal transduction histidine kinase
LHRYRLGRLLELERVRLRIATDLHDDIGSTLSQIAVLSELVTHHLPSEDAVAERLTTIASLSRDLVDSLSDIVWAINPKRDHLSDLTYRMRRFAGDLLTPRGIEFQIAAPSSADDLTTGADLRREVFLIFKEAVNNAARHSACTRVDTGFEVNNGFLQLQVVDNGRGSDAFDEGAGNGIPSMRQRASRLGGTLEVQSRPGGGTTVQLRAPLDRRRRRVRPRRPYISM